MVSNIEKTVTLRFLIVIILVLVLLQKANYRLQRYK